MAPATASPPSPETPARPQPRNPTDLFWSFTWLALQGFGGVLAVVQRELVEKKRWLTNDEFVEDWACLLYTSPSPRDKRQSRMPSSA